MSFTAFWKLAIRSRSSVAAELLSVSNSTALSTLSIVWSMAALMG